MIADTDVRDVIAPAANKLTEKNAREAPASDPLYGIGDAVVHALLMAGYEINKPAEIADALTQVAGDSIQLVEAELAEAGLVVVPAEDILTALTETDALYSDCAAALRRVALPATEETE